MIYVQRDSSGTIIALHKSRSDEASEQISPDDQEVLDFLLMEDDDQKSKVFLSETDTRMARIVEDLIQVLIEKNMIMFTDLPGEAQKKIIARKQLRESIQGNDILLSDEDLPI